MKSIQRYMNQPMSQAVMNDWSGPTANVHNLQAMGANYGKPQHHAQGGYSQAPQGYNGPRAQGTPSGPPQGYTGNRTGGDGRINPNMNQWQQQQQMNQGGYSQAPQGYNGPQAQASAPGGMQQPMPMQRPQQPMPMGGGQPIQPFGQGPQNGMAQAQGMGQHPMGPAPMGGMQTGMRPPPPQQGQGTPPPGAMNGMLGPIGDPNRQAMNAAQGALGAYQGMQNKPQPLQPGQYQQVAGMASGQGDPLANSISGKREQGGYALPNMANYVPYASKAVGLMSRPPRR